MYDFYEKLRKTTEELGGLFDPQPGQVLGNIHSTTDPSENVIGIFNGGTVEQQRLFVYYYDLPRYLQQQPRYSCPVDTVLVDDLPSWNSNGRNLVGQIYEGPVLVAWVYTTQFCSDCRRLGGINQKPTFWP